MSITPYHHFDPSFPPHTLDLDSCDALRGLPNRIVRNLFEGVIRGEPAIPKKDKINCEC